MTENDFPLIVLVHVPKTAGTTVKSLLSECSPRGRSFDRRKYLERPDFSHYARQADWISGHIGRDIFACAMIWVQRKVEYYSMVRKPVEQLISHLNFSFERSKADGHLGSRSAKERKLDLDVTSTDFSDPGSVRDLLLDRKKHYFNNQSRLIIGEDYKTISENEISRRLGTYTFIAPTSDLPKLYRAFGFARLPDQAGAIRENVSRSHFNPAIFEAPELKKFLAHHLVHDFRLYEHIVARKWPAEARVPDRPAYLKAEEVTADNFDEAAYLRSNEDVAAGVADGLFTSGRHHFDAFGHREKRYMRRLVSARNL